MNIIFYYEKLVKMINEDEIEEWNNLISKLELVHQSFDFYAQYDRVGHIIMTVKPRLEKFDHVHNWAIKLIRDKLQSKALEFI